LLKLSVTPLYWFAEGIVLEACASPLKDKDGMLTGGVGAFRDITESRRRTRYGMNAHSIF